MKTIASALVGLLFAAMIIMLVACSSVVRQGPDPTPGVGLRLVAHGKGSGDVQVFADQIPLTAFVSITGEYTITGRPFPPFVTIDGATNLIVEPAPGLENEAMRAVSRGDILIRRSGVPGQLNSPGSGAASLRPPVRSSPPPPEPPVVSTGLVCSGEGCEKK